MVNYITNFMTKRTGLISGIVGLVLAGTLIGVADYQKKQDEKLINDSNARIVSGITYHSGALTSEGFLGCSAVVLDWGEEAIMAHALPYLRPNLIRRGVTLFTAGGVVERLIDESSKYGLNPKDAEAHINSGDKKSLLRIIKNLENNSIKIAKAELRFQDEYLPKFSSPKTLTYIPTKNKFYISQ
jgi:hypothetical protein